MLWPSPRLLPGERLGTSGVKFFYLGSSEEASAPHLDPTLFAQAASARTAEAREEALPALAVSMMPTRARLLPAPETGIVCPAPAASIEVERLRQAKFTLAEDAEPAQGSRPQPVVRAFEDVDPGLKARGFRLPEMPEALRAAKHPWTVQLWIEMDPAGRPEQVFLDAGCGDPQINAAVVRWGCWAQAERAQESSSGRVRVGLEYKEGP